MWDNIFNKNTQALTDLLSKANARHEENTAALVEEVEALKKKVSSVCRRNEKLSDQLGFLNEVAIRCAVGKIHGKEAAEQAHIHSLQGLCALLVAKDVPFRRHEAELASRQTALVEAVVSPDCFVAFTRLFMGRLTEYHKGNRRAISYIRKAQASTEEVSLYLGSRTCLHRGRKIEDAITQLQTLEAVVTQEANKSGEQEQEEKENGSEVDELDEDIVREKTPAYWSGRFFSGLIRYLRAAKGGLMKLRAHLAQPDSLGIALLAAASSQLLCVQVELDGRGSLEVFPDAAIISVFEYKSSQSGVAKGKQQLEARLQMLMWAARQSRAVPSDVPITGRGHLYLPGYARIRPQDVTLDGGNMTISVASI